jgi:hypothetical protein
MPVCYLPGSLRVYEIPLELLDCLEMLNDGG